ncbi:MAG: diaminopimelate dehydrogenase [Bacillota bacterium]|nr:diaminopimelate dehydrogenase [Bacillota bacterium]
MTIRIGIMGYGNLGRGVECAIKQAPDMELAAVFTRRDPKDIKILTESVNVYSVDDVEKFSPVTGADPEHAIDVLIICGGSATDLPQQTPKYASLFNVVDSFDTHARIPEHFANVDAASKGARTTAVISAGWDPGMFSVTRLYSESILPAGATYTFWGKGVSQGHSDAVRRIDGVIDARQYTIPVEAALEAVRSGSEPELTTRQKHTREVFVVAEEGADKERIVNEIVTMKNYFDEYDTTVHFIDEEEMARDHSGIPHGGFVIRSGKTGWNEEHSHVVEYKLALDSNPEFTSSVLVAVARAAFKMSQEGMYGAKTIFDIAPAYLSPKTGEELRKTML